MNYQLELEKIIKENKDKIPKLLLHSCCGPCSTYVLEYLSNYFEITIYYYNPNIDSKDEFLKRLEEQIKVINKFSFNKIDIIVGEYEPDIYLQCIKGLEKLPEGKNRCDKCFELRLKKTAILAQFKRFDYFGTTLTVSPHKNSLKINKIGEKLEQEFNISFLYSDFKKKEGYKRSIELSKELGLYRQDYCGCEFSKIRVIDKYF